MGFDMGANGTQNFAEGKPVLRKSTRVTPSRRRGMPRAMPEMSEEARAAYSAARVRAAMTAVRDELDWSWNKWAGIAGLAEATVRNFVTGNPEDDDKSMLLSGVVRLAWAADVSVSRLIGEAEPQPAEPPSSTIVDQLRREIEQTAVQQGLLEQLLALHKKLDGVERELAVAKRERDALRLQIAEIPPRE
jgi:hypothetical protein